MCDCIEKTNKLLEKYNTRIYVPMLIDFATGKTHSSRTILITTEKINPNRRSGRAKSLLATYCPFCGKKYEEDK
jgi:hypothetical protein